MASVNKVIIIGNLGADPETRFAPSGDAIANIRVATTEKWKDKAGETQERTEWHSIGEPAARKPAPNRGATFEDMDDDIPF